MATGLDDDEDDAADDDEIVAPASLNIPKMSDLLGIDPAVYRQINAALASGKRHIMLYGPPGTGKTTLARHIATVLTGGRWTLVTGSSDWSSQDIIGGYQPVGSGAVGFAATYVRQTTIWRAMIETHQRLWGSFHRPIHRHP